MDDMDNIDYAYLVGALQECNAEIASKMVDSRLWSKTSLVVWLNDGSKYKCKYRGSGSFVIQKLSDEDINKKFGGAI